jgi:hypothetical protein
MYTTEDSEILNTQHVAVIDDIKGIGSEESLTNGLRHGLNSDCKCLCFFYTKIHGMGEQYIWKHDDNNIRIDLTKVILKTTNIQYF